MNFATIPLINRVICYTASSYRFCHEPPFIVVHGRCVIKCDFANNQFAKLAWHGRTFRNDIGIENTSEYHRVNLIHGPATPTEAGIYLFIIAC